MPTTTRTTSRRTKQGDTTPTYRPLVLERWRVSGLPHRLVVLEDGALEIQHRTLVGTWLRDIIAHDTGSDVCFPVA